MRELTIDELEQVCGGAARASFSMTETQCVGAMTLAGAGIGVVVSGFNPGVVGLTAALGGAFGAIVCADLTRLPAKTATSASQLSSIFALSAVKPTDEDGDG